MSKFEAPRGTHDILPPEVPRWQLVIDIFEELCGLYGYRRIQTPVFEDTELFVRTSGHGSDVVSKEMYTFTDRGDRSLTLRAEATAPIVRAYLEHGMHRDPQPVKLYAYETIYRYGRPQKGRFREHWQLDLEAIGSDDPAVDAEVIQLYDALLQRLAVPGYHLELNSIGDSNCRPQYLEDHLKPWLAEHQGELDEATREQASRNPLRALDNIWGKHSDVRNVLLRLGIGRHFQVAVDAEHLADRHFHVGQPGNGFSRDGHSSSGAPTGEADAVWRGSDVTTDLLAETPRVENWVARISNNPRISDSCTPG